jgi:DNA-directed RNA polymerase sigma subunit (sigma70/sigma32)
MTSFLWPAEDGWPYPDPTDRGAEVIDLDAEADDDLLSLKIPPPHLFDELDPIERQVITSHSGLNGSPALSMKQLHHELGLSRRDLRDVLGSGLAKLREHLQA